MHLSISLLILVLGASIITGKVSKQKEVLVWSVIGSRAELPCPPAPRLKNDKPVLVLWYRGSYTLPVYSYDARDGSFESGVRWSGDVWGKRAFFTVLARTPALILDPTQEGDEGIYTCRVDYRLSPSTTHTINLTIAVPPGPPLLVYNGVSVSGSLGPVLEGARVEIWCRSEGGRPPPIVTWWLQGSKLPGQTTSIITNPDTGVQRVEARVWVVAKRELYGATLTCLTQTPTPKHSHTTTTIHPRTAHVILNITLAPLEVRITGPTSGVSTGTALRLVCRAIGSHPSATLTWWRGHTHLTRVSKSIDDGGNITTSTLTTVAKREHDGTTVACTATNPLMPDTPITHTIKIKVFYRPVVVLALGRPLDPSRIKEGDDVFFECTIIANPPAIRIHWYHNGGKVKHNAREGVIVAGQSLALRGVQRHHTGTYTCSATNTEGTNTSNHVHLHVQYAPTCAGGVSERTQLAARGLPAVVWCRVEAQPPQNITWSWQRILIDGTVMTVPHDRIRSDDLTSRVEVTPISPGDYGEVVCRATSIIGRQKKPCVVTLVPAGPPDPPLNCTATHDSTTHDGVSTPAQDHLSLTITCLEGFDGGLPQKFLILAWQEEVLVANMTSEFPEWVLEGLTGGDGARVKVVALNARGTSKPFILQVPRASARHHITNESVSDEVDISAMVGAGVGAAAVLVLVVVVAMMITRQQNNNNNYKHPVNKPQVTREVIWENYNPDLVSSEYNIRNSLSEPDFTRTQSLVNVHTQTPTNSPTQPASPPTIQLNGRIVNERNSIQVETAAQGSESDCTEESEPESVIEVIKLSPATRQRFAGLSKGAKIPAYVAVSTREPSKGMGENGQHSNIHSNSSNNTSRESYNTSNGIGESTQHSNIHPNTSNNTSRETYNTTNEIRESSQHSNIHSKTSNNIRESCSATEASNSTCQPLSVKDNICVLPNKRVYKGSPRTLRNRRKLPKIQNGRVVRFDKQELLMPKTGSQVQVSGNRNRVEILPRINERNMRDNPPRKPPRTFSQSSIVSGTRYPVLNSNSCPSGFFPPSPDDFGMNMVPQKTQRAPLAEDEVRDAYRTEDSRHNFRLIESDI